jgi:gas vesicle protein
MEREDTFPLWAVLLGVAAGGCVAYLLANPRGKTLLRNLPRMLRDLTQQSERVLGIVRELTTEMEQSLQKVEQSLQKVESSLGDVQQTLQREAAVSGGSSSFQPQAA